MDKERRQKTPVFIPRVHFPLLKNQVYRDFITSLVKKKNLNVFSIPELLLEDKGSYKEIFENLLKSKILIQERSDWDENESNLVNESLFYLKTAYPSYSIGEGFSRRHVELNFENIGKILENSGNFFGISIRDHDYLNILHEISKRDTWNHLHSILFSDFSLNSRNIDATVKKSRIISTHFRLDILRCVKSKAFPFQLASLVSAGIDGIMERGYLTAAEKGMYFTSDGITNIQELRELPCNCPSCEFLMANDHGIQGDIDRVLHLYIHNVNQALNEIVKIRNLLRSDKFRDYLEYQSQSSVILTVFRKKLDLHSKDLAGSSTSLVKKAKVEFRGTGSYYRPDVIKFRSKVIKHFTFPRRTEYVILLPCSARKPYFESPSHVKFHQAMRGGWNKWFRYCSELIITSPIGLVPRQLENCFPAAHYDVPVTGYWDEQELEFSKDMLVNVINHNLDSGVKIKGIIAHLEGGYRKACELAESSMRIPLKYTGNFESATILEALDALRDEFSSIEATLTQNAYNDGLNKNDVKLEDFKVLLNFQFETNLGDVVLPENTKIRKDRRNTTIIIDGKTNSTVFSRDQNSGYLKLERLGVERAWGGHLGNKDIHLKKVEFKGDALKGSNLFPAGIEHADEGITVGDDVFIHDGDNRLMGYGRAIVPGSRMLEMKTGPVIMLLHKMNKRSEGCPQ
ncbi:MAG: DUF5591 domain-containing protein [Candidatus Hodarchaeota archaeon]